MLDPALPLILIDGGASGTRLRLCGSDYGVLATATAGPSSLTLGVAKAWDTITTGLSSLPLSSPAHLVCGLAGARTPDRAARFRATAPASCAELSLVTDGYAALIGAHGGAPGAVLALGTGVSADALRPDGSVLSASGWGFAIGDEGGGAWIGRAAMGRLSRHLDGRAKMTGPLADALMARTGPDYAGIQSWLSKADPARFAALAPVVVEAAGGGDPDAEAILAQATEALSEALRAIAQPGETPVALLGGLARAFVPRLAREWALVAPQGNGLDGLALIARGHAAAEVPA